MRLSVSEYNYSGGYSRPKCINYFLTDLTQLEIDTKATSSQIRTNLDTLLGRLGWSKGLRVSPSSRIAITAYLEDVGMCIQTGNVSRMYADLLKLQTLFANSYIKVAIYVLPTSDLGREIGSNIASFERLESEIEIFERTITIPITMVGIGR